MQFPLLKMSEPNNTEMSNNSKNTKHYLETDLEESEARYLAYSNRLAQILRLVGSSPIGRSVSSVNRYFAYTSDVGEAARPIIPPSLVKLAYGISWGYVICDVSLETLKAYEATNKDKDAAIRHGGERLVFNTFASMLLPMMTIHTVVHQAQKFTMNNPSLFVRGAIPTMAGMAILPALPFIFDKPTEYVVEKLFERIWPYKNSYHSQFLVGHDKRDVITDTTTESGKL